MPAQSVLREIRHDERGHSAELLDRLDCFPESLFLQKIDVEDIMRLKHALQGALHPLGRFNRVRNMRHHFG
jgi:hypothetical protein